ncbi:MFS transporter [Humibacillus xanthopallidus]|uniref:DHA2 family multidrug resistance protein-like MFS transporter n=1 Tax=Humibacillus xanthopallidus TaxID=412689 RepID=A0A543I1L9_9MICO|nr:MFS transporter [Humibacillus xanthopallidus]TQM64471.1 DHA2 family multidrug resistance protein-like MFS transporter [Humibacillus xanthopallidus]
MSEPTTEPITDVPARAERREWTALGVLCLPLLMVSMDVSVLFFAVPHIAESLDPTATQVLWIFDVYGFVLAGLLLTMGGVADRIGRRRLLLLGAVAFAAASVLAAYAPSAEWLIAARALLGVGGATLMPSTLALVRNLFADGAERAKAVGIWSAVMAGGVGIGPVISGLLLEHFWWGSVFLINVPIMIALLLVAPFLLPESRSRSSRVDLLSSVLSLLAILPVVHVLKSIATRGWSSTMLPYAVLGGLSAVTFVRRQSRIGSPMVDLTLFARRGFGGSIVVQVIGMFGVMGNAVLMTQYLQSVLGYSALQAALWSLLPSVAVGAAAPTAAALSGRVGRPVVMASGFVLAATGFVAIRLADVHSSIWPALLCAALIAMGLVSVATLVTEYAIGVAPASRAGSVSGLVETAGELGGALGMAVLGSVLAAVYTSHVADLLPADLASGARSAASETLGGAVVASADLGGAQGAAVLEAARTAYVDGLHAASLVAAAILLVGAVVALATMPHSQSVVESERVASRL